MQQPIDVVVHTKACLAALGLVEGLAVVAEAGFSNVVVWAGEGGEYLSGVMLCRQLGLRVVALASPKLLGLVNESSTLLNSWLALAEKLDVPALSLILGDARDTPVASDVWGELCQILRSAGVAVLVENNGHLSERFADPHEIERLLEAAPALRVSLDLGHLTSSGHINSDFSALTGRIASVDVHDNDGVNDLHLSLGHGTASGSFTIGLQRLPMLPTRIVIETDARCGTDRVAWIEALRSDRARLESALAAHFRYYMSTPS